MNEKKYSYTHLRQSEQWFNFWKLMGWHKIVFDTNLSARVSKTIFGSTMIIEKPKEINDEMLNKIEKYAKDNKIAILHIKPGLSQINDSLEKHDYSLIDGSSDITKTGIINLNTPLDVLSKNFSYRVRHLIAVSRKKTMFNITEKYSDQDVDEFHHTYRHNSHSKKYFTYDKKSFIYFMRSFKNHAYLCIVKNAKNEYLGGCVFACEGKTAWYIFSAINEKGRKYNVGYGMIWEGIIFLKSKGFEYLDLEGLRDERYAKTNSCQSGYSEFKEHFHPDIIYYPKVRIKYFNKLARLLNIV